MPPKLGLLKKKTERRSKRSERMKKYWADREAAVEAEDDNNVISDMEIEDQEPTQPIRVLQRQATAVLEQPPVAMPLPVAAAAGPLVRQQARVFQRQPSVGVPDYLNDPEFDFAIVPQTAVDRANQQQPRQPASKKAFVQVAPLRPADEEDEEEARTPPPKRRKAGTVALKEIRRYQRSVKALIPKIAFSRLVREITGDVGRRHDIDFRFQRYAIEALQDASEAYISSLFESSNLFAIHAKRVTVKPADMMNVRRIGGNKMKLQ